MNDSVFFLLPSSFCGALGLSSQAGGKMSTRDQLKRVYTVQAIG
jgi:hypothetical protein